MSFKRTPGGEQPRIVIIGAGIGGLSFAIALKRQLGYENFTIFEKAQSVGGTWRDNVYPGCSSDIAAHFYSLSTDLNANWSYTHPFQPELERYWDGLSLKYSLSSHIVFNCMVIAASWDAEEHAYHITTKNVITGEQSSTTAQVLISALGILEVPRFPDIPGISDFKHLIFHSARWVDTALSGKRVAVIGNGASATQFLPVISKQPGIHVTQFCRTPNWVLPPVRYSDSVFVVAKMAVHTNSINYASVSHHSIYQELSYLLIFHNRILRSLVAKSFTDYVKRAAPAKYHKELIPDYSLGCKRVTFDTDYLAALHQDNVELNWQGVASFVEDGIVTKKGEHLKFDVIILATGYSADRYPLSVRGIKESIQEYHDNQGGPTAYLGTSTPGFPNFYIIGGPNTSTGHTSVLFTEEIQANYIIKLIKPILDRKVASLDISTSATDKYNSKIQARLSDSVFVHCRSWYRVNDTGKVNSMFPGPVALFWWWMRRPVWSDYRAGGVTVSDQWIPGENHSVWSTMKVPIMGITIALVGVWILF